MGQTDVTLIFRGLVKSTYAKLILMLSEYICMIMIVFFCLFFFYKYMMFLLYLICLYNLSSFLRKMKN